MRKESGYDTARQIDIGFDTIRYDTKHTMREREREKKIVQIAISHTHRYKWRLAIGRWDDMRMDGKRRRRMI